MLEIFKPIENYPDYLISNKGRVYSSKRNKFLKPKNSKQGYLTIKLSEHSIIKEFKIHRLIAEAFILNPDNLPQVNHRDEDKTNNCVDNLEWCDAKYNNNYGTARLRMTEKTKKPVLQFSLDGEFIKEYESVKEASLTFYTKRTSSINNCLAGRTKSAYGFYWKYK